MLRIVSAFYSSILPNLYSYILAQSKRFATEALNRHQTTLRMRGRPKVVLARTYEEAMRIYTKFADNCLGVISDARFPIKEISPKENILQPSPLRDSAVYKDPEAGLKLLRSIRQHDEYVALIMESSESEYRKKAEAENFRFIE